jgi:hypothetical protein
VVFYDEIKEVSKENDVLCHLLLRELAGGDNIRTQSLPGLVF